MKQSKIKQLNNRNFQNILNTLPANGCEELARNIREILAKDKKKWWENYQTRSNILIEEIKKANKLK